MAERWHLARVRVRVRVRVKVRVRGRGKGRVRVRVRVTVLTRESNRIYCLCHSKLFFFLLYVLKLHVIRLF